MGLAVGAVEIRAQDRPSTPAEKYQAFVKENQERENASDKEYMASAPKDRLPSDETRMEYIGPTCWIKHENESKLLDLAEEYPKDPIAVDEAVWQVNATLWPVELVGRDEASPRDFTYLRRNHVHSDRIGPLCERIFGGFRDEYETFLRAVLEENPHREVRARACLALAHLPTHRMQRIDLTRDQPGLAGEFTGLYGKTYLARLQGHDRCTATGEPKSLFE